MKPSLRRFQHEDDYWRIRGFLRQVFLLNDRRELSWQPYRFDYCRWHCYENIEHCRMEDVIYIWENGDGKIAAVLNPENLGDVFLHVHPALRTEQLETEMIETAEQQLAASDAEGRRRVRIWVESNDELRQSILMGRGYTKGSWPEYQRRRSMNMLIPNPPLAEGYTIRALGDSDELPARSWISWKAFHPDEPDERYEGWEWYRNVQRAPLYRRDLDLMVVAPNGEFASFCTIWFDDVTRTGAFEPVGTAPAHQRLGLGKALMCEGLRRLERLGATQATVGAYSVRANALYASAGFTSYDTSDPWQKTL